MNLRWKILSGFLILSLILLLAVVWAVGQLSDLGLSAQKLLDDNYRSIGAADRMAEALERQDSAVLFLLLGRWEEGRAILEAADGSFEESLATARGNLTIPGEGAYVDDVESAYRSFKGIWVRPIVGTAREGNLDWYIHQVHPAFLTAKAAVAKLKALNDKAMYESSSGLKNRADRAVMPGVVAVMAALVFSLLFNYFVNYYVVSPIIRITQGADRFLKTGQPLSVRVETRDEIGRLASAVGALCSEARMARKG